MAQMRLVWLCLWKMYVGSRGVCMVFRKKTLVTSTSKEKKTYIQGPNVEPLVLSFPFPFCLVSVSSVTVVYDSGGGMLLNTIRS